MSVVSSHRYTVMDRKTKVVRHGLTVGEVAILLGIEKKRVYDVANLGTCVKRRWLVSHSAAINFDSPKGEHAWEIWFTNEWEKMQRLFGIGDAGAGSGDEQGQKV